MAFDEHLESYKDKRFKTRNWCVICYTENMREDWRESISDLLDCPGFYAVHDMDLDKDGAKRKEHIHLSFVWPGPINVKTAVNLVNARLSSDESGKGNCCSCGQPISNFRGNYDYAIHATDKAQEDGKYQYPVEARVCFNGFDIGFFEQLSQAEKDEICFEISEMISRRRIDNLAELRDIISKERDMTWFMVFKNNNAFFDRLCRGEYLKKDKKAKSRIEEEKEYLEPAAVAMTGETIVRGTDGIRRVVCSECGKVDVDDAFVVYGGSEGRNIGICRECAKRKRESE